LTPDVSPIAVGKGAVARPVMLEGVLLPRIISALLCLGAVLLIVHTYKVFDQTWDEPATLGAGIDWYTYHNYTLHPLDPPLPRIFAGALPYFLFHARAQGVKEPFYEGNAILAAGDYDRILTSARVGVLPFFLFAVFLVWKRTRDWLGEWPAVIAVLLLCTCEPVLGHAGESTTDVCFMAMFFLALDRMWQFCVAPTLRNALLFGVAAGLTVVSKLTAIPYLLLAGALLFVWVLIFRGEAQQARSWTVPIQRWRLIFSSLLACVVVVWAVYLFNIGPVFPPGDTGRDVVDQFLKNHGFTEGPVFAVLDHVPAGSFFTGLRDARGLGKGLPPSYIFGKVNYTGKWYYFPVALLVKTPIPFLIFCIGGSVLALLRLWRREDMYPIVLLVGVVTPLLFGMIGRVNVGIRHVLSVYPFLVMLGAFGAIYLWRQRPAARAAVAILLLWQCGACVYASPDFIPYFNEAAAAHADYLLSDSDLDWGQDLKRVAPVLRGLGADHIFIDYNGTEDLNRVGLPPWQRLKSRDRPSGWLVISEWHLKRDGYGWLERYQPVAKAGHSIYIYHVP
jgi:hypothetical protein